MSRSPCTAIPRHRGPVSVLGPCTGLGLALLIGSHPHGWHAVETEGGHVITHPHPGLLGAACARRAPEL